ncbi:RNA-directed DNA polymerase, eukaryota [Tanacetum coccineum]
MKFLTGSGVHGGYKLSNESLLERLSCNIFITNFPVHLSANELWNTYAQYGTIQDVYIPNKLSKHGKPFVFARFSKVNDVDTYAIAHATFKRIASKRGELVYIDESNASNKYSMHLCVKTRVHHLISESFKVILEGKVSVVHAKEVTRWVPNFGEDDIAQSEECSDNNSVGIHNWERENDDEVIPHSFQSIVNEYNIVENSPDDVENSPRKMENTLDHVENYDVQVENSPEISPKQLENSHVHVENSHVHVENSLEQMENSSVHVENSHAHVKNSLDLSGVPFSLEKIILESEKSAPM